MTNKFIAVEKLHGLIDAFSDVVFVAKRDDDLTTAYNYEAVIGKLQSILSQTVEVDIEDLWRGIREFGYTTKAQTDEIVDAIRAALGIGHE